LKVVFGIIILLIILGVLFLGELFVFGSTSYTETNSDISKTTSRSDENVEEIVSTSNNTTLSSDEPVKEIVSTSLSDFTPYFDPTATELQKETFFNEKLNDPVW